MHESLTRELRSTDIESSRTILSRLGTIGAFFCLAFVDASMRLASFHRFYRLVSGFPTLGKPPRDPARIPAICAAVDRAATLYFKRAWCLQRSATVVCLLRLWGVPAQLVIGARKMPFSAHAWAEMDGRVLNDSPVVKKLYTELERC